MNISSFEILGQQIQNAPGGDFPFSHYYFDKFFDEDLYNSILANLPDNSLYESFYHADAVTDYGSTRYRFIFNQENLAKLPSQDFWRPVVDYFQSQEFRNLVFNRLKTDILKRFGTLEVKCDPTVLLYRDFSGYKISPHPDHKTKVVTVQFYLPKDDSIRDAGTCLYIKKEKKYIIHKKMEFLPRHGYGFAVSDKSWHGVEEIKQKEVQRDSLMVIYYQPK